MSFNRRLRRQQEQELVHVDDVRRELEKSRDRFVASYPGVDAASLVGDTVAEHIGHLAPYLDTSGRVAAGKLVPLALALKLTGEAFHAVSRDPASLEKMIEPGAIRTAFRALRKRYAVANTGTPFHEIEQVLDPPGPLPAHEVAVYAMQTLIVAEGLFAATRTTLKGPVN